MPRLTLTPEDADRLAKMDADDPEIRDRCEQTYADAVPAWWWFESFGPSRFRRLLLPAPVRSKLLAVLLHPRRGAYACGATLLQIDSRRRGWCAVCWSRSNDSTIRAQNHLMSTVMAHEYRVTWCKTDKLSQTVKEWTEHEAGWELHNATCGGTTYGPGGRYVELTHFLYFRKEF